MIGNSGLQDVTGVRVRDPLPAGVIFDQAIDVDGAGFACAYDVPTNVVTCTGGSIPGQSTRTLKFVTVAPPGVGQITNTVTVDPNNAIFEADESNNTFTQVTQVATGIDLTVSKHSNHETNFVATRGTLTYTIKVSNLGTQDANNILVRDALPADTIFRDAVSDPAHGFSCSHSGGVVDCISGHIQGTESMNYPNPPGTNVDTATITIRVFATAYEQPAMHNEVRVDPLNQIGEVNENNNLAVQNTEVKSGGTTNDAFNELIISKEQKSPDPANTARNAVVTYEIKVGNDGTDPVVAVKVRDTLPAGARYIEAIGTNSFLCQQQLIGFVDCVGGQIAANTLLADPGAATITIKAFAPDTPGTYTNQVEVDPDHTIAEGNEFNNNASAQTVVKNGGAGSFHELSVTKDQTDPADESNTARNAMVTYSIVVTNNGSDAVNGVVVRDKLPAGARYIQANGNNPANQFLCTEEQTGIVDCINGQVAGGGGTATITLKMFAPDTPGAYVNQVNVDPDNAIPEGDEFNNLATFETTVTNGGEGDFNDLSVSKTASPSPVKPNEVLTYTLTVSNTEGEAPALDVKVRDVLSSMVTFISAVDLGGPGAFTCSESSLTVTCVGGTIPAGGSRTITIKVKAPNLTDVTLLNQAMADPENEIPEGNEANNNFDLATQVSSNINLTIKKDGPDTSSQGQVSTYKITIENQSPTSQGVGSDAGQMAFNVEVHDPLPVGLIPLAVFTGSNNNFQCQVAENPINVVDCIGDLAPDSPVEISVDVFMTAEGNRKLDNEACIDPSDTIKEFSKPDGSLGETDNCSTHTSLGGTPPKRSPNFLVSKSVNQSVASPGETLEYTITVSNIGDADHLGLITVTDNLPDDTTAVDITGPNGWTCSAAADSMTCDNSGLSGDDQRLAIGSTVQFTVHATVKDDANGQLVNSASASNALHDGAETDAEDETAANLPNSATATTSVGSPGIDLSIGTITDSPDPVNAGQQITWTVVAVNAGTQAESNVHIEVTLPSGISFVGADGSNGFNCDAPVGSLLDCHAANMPAGGNTTITIKALVLLAPPGTLTLSAHIDPRAGESNTLNNDQSEVTTVSGSVCTTCVDLVSAVLTASPEPVNQNGSVTVKYVIINTGDMPTSFTAGQPLAFFDFSGAHTSFSVTSSDPSAFTCTSAGSGATFELNDCFGNLGPGQGVTFTATIGGLTGDSLFITGNADPGLLITEFSELNNILTQTVVINP